MPLILTTPYLDKMPLTVKKLFIENVDNACQASDFSRIPANTFLTHFYPNVKGELDWINIQSTCGSTFFSIC